jgi:hypothetical protein
VLGDAECDCDSLSMCLHMGNTTTESCFPLGDSAVAVAAPAWGAGQRGMGPLSTDIANIVFRAGGAWHWSAAGCCGAASPKSNAELRPDVGFLVGVGPVTRPLYRRVSTYGRRR